MCENCTNETHKEWVCLHSHSEHSLLDGYAKIEDYVNTAKERGSIGFGLTDHGTCTGLYEMINYCNEQGVKPVPGFEAYVAPENPEGSLCRKPVYYGKGGMKARKYDVGGNGAYLHLTLFAYNQQGLHNLLKLTSISWEKERFYQKPRIDTDLLFEYNEGLIVTTGCPSSEISTRFLLGQDDKAYEYASRLKSVFEGRMYVEVMDHAMENEDLERILLPKLRKLAADLDLPFLATNDCHYVFKEDAQAHEHMLALQTDAKMTEPSFSEGGRRFAFSGPEYYMKTDAEMRELFPEDLYPGAVDNTHDLVLGVEDISIDYDTHLRPEIEIPEGYTEETYLMKLIDEGFQRKRGNHSDEVKKESIKRIKHEFEVIESNDFINYFLVVEDYIRWAHENGVPTGKGRGCFIEDSPVEVPSGTTTLKDIQIGDQVFVHNKEYAEVTDKFEYEVEDEDMTSVTLSTNETLTSTSDHLYLTLNNGYLRADELKEGMTLLSVKDNGMTIEELGRNVKVDSMISYPYNSIKYDDGQILPQVVTDKGTHMALSFAELTGMPYEVNQAIIKLGNDNVSVMTKIITLQDDEFEQNLVILPDHMVETGKMLRTDIHGINSLVMNEITARTLLVGENHHFVTVKKTESFNYTGKVIDLEVAECRNYNIGGVIVHNSVGGSEIAYVLDISDTDPIKYNLLFERFLSPGRGSVYVIVTEDGVEHELAVSDKVLVLTKEGKEEIKYVHKVEPGEAIIGFEETDGHVMTEEERKEAEELKDDEDEYLEQEFVLDEYEDVII